MRLRRVGLCSLAIALAVAGCGEPAGPSAAEGEYSFAAEYGANGYSCSVTGSILSLQHNLLGWAGRLSGGEIGCTGGIPGEIPVPGPPDNALDSIVVRGDSVSFRLAGTQFVARGILEGGNLAGTLRIATPLSQSIDSLMIGTWTGTRLQPS